MSVLGYFGPRRGELRMPKKTDPLGIRYYGPVLTGRMSLELAQELNQGSPDWNGEFAHPPDYDPVLRSHCRLEVGEVTDRVDTVKVNPENALPGLEPDGVEPLDRPHKGDLS